NPVARPDVTTTYTVTITTPEGCTATDEVTVTVIPAISVPNAFSPNGDRVNDVWELGNIENYPDARVEIFNRWGNQIFTSNGYGTPWDGTYNGEALPVATYYYIIYLNSSEKHISGHVTIIR
ncbi:MAG: gliding motility-associated C-terminal domain-containing protein, partial [Hymenobacteraceae bacterium]|nr:gliding motility-associated C-terminal domain-containing protein [Hymenobacteraceae bacterium]